MLNGFVNLSIPFHTILFNGIIKKCNRIWLFALKICIPSSFLDKAYFLSLGTQSKTKLEKSLSPILVSIFAVIYFPTLIFCREIKINFSIFISFSKVIAIISRYVHVTISCWIKLFTRCHKIEHKCQEHNICNWHIL